MSAVDLIREQFHAAHHALEACMSDVTPDATHWRPTGTAHPVGSRYVHAVVAEDALMSVLRKEQPLFMAGWAGRTGASDPQMFATEEWAKALRVDLPQFRQYAAAVHEQSLAHLATLKDGDLDGEIDLSAYGQGKMSLGFFLSRYFVAHIYEICGEIYAIKGAQGLKGSPL